MWLLLLSLVNQSLAAPGLPLRALSYSVEVSGPIAEIVIRQTFHAEGNTAIEATYTFPLQADAAVDALRIEVGDRVIEGEIHDIDAARQIYADAVATGHLAAITEQNRPNVFTQRVGNIPPGADVKVELHVLAPVLHKDGAWELVIPLVVAPRFIPDGTPDAQALDKVYVGSDSVLAAIAGPEVDIDVAVHAGLPLQRVESPTHSVDVALHGDDAETRLSHVPPDRDFVLRWWTATDSPQVGMLVSGSHALLTFEPPTLSRYGDRVPRDLVFVLDQSCSMSGQPLDLSKQAMRAALQQLDPRDSVQIVAFSDRTRTLWRDSRDATPRHVRKARYFVRRLHANGGTFLLETVSALLDAPVDPARHRVIVLLTDGQVENDDSVLAAIAAHTDSSVSAIGIGSAPNHYLLDEIATLGGGVAAYITLDEAPDAAIDRMLDAMDRPVLTDLRIDWGAWAATSMYPSRLPDLHTGQPVLVSAKINPDGDGPVSVSGRVGAGSFTQVISPERIARDRALATTWARQRVADIHRRRLRGEITDERPAILQTGLEYHILTDYTSFVAVEWDRVANPGGRPAQEDQLLFIPGASLPSDAPRWLLDGLGSTDPLTGTFSSTQNLSFGTDLLYVQSSLPLVDRRPPPPPMRVYSPTELPLPWSNDRWKYIIRAAGMGVNRQAAEAGASVGATLTGPILQDSLWLASVADAKAVNTAAIDLRAIDLKATLTAQPTSQHRLIGAANLDPALAISADGRARYGGPSGSLRWQWFPNPDTMTQTWLSAARTHVAGDDRARVEGAAEFRRLDEGPVGVRHEVALSASGAGLDWTDADQSVHATLATLSAHDTLTPYRGIDLLLGWRSARLGSEEPRWMHSPTLALDLHHDGGRETRILAGASREETAPSLVAVTRDERAWFELRQQIVPAVLILGAARAQRSQALFAPPVEWSSLAQTLAAPIIEIRSTQTELTLQMEPDYIGHLELTWLWNRALDDQDALLAQPVAYWTPELLDAHRAHQLRGSVDWSNTWVGSPLEVGLHGAWGSAIPGAELWWLDASSSVGIHVDDTIDLGAVNLTLKLAATRGVNSPDGYLLPVQILATDADAPEIGDLPPWRGEAAISLEF